MFYVRPRRYYKNESNEVWSMEHSYGEGFVAEDKMIIRFSKPNVNAWLIVKDKSRKNIEEYIIYAYALFDDIVPESGESNVKVIVDANVQEYWPEELIEKYSTDENTKDDL